MYKSLLYTMIVSSGRLSLALSAFIVNIILVRKLSPEEFGIVVTITTLGALLPTLIDFGTSISLVRFGAVYAEQGERRNLLRVYSSIFHLRNGIGIIIVMLSFLFTAPIAHLLLHSSVSVPWIRWTVIGSLFTTLVFFLQALLQIEEKFIHFSSLNIIEGMAKILGIAGVIFLLRGGIDMVIGVYVVTPMLIFIVGAQYISWDFLRTSPNLSTLSILFNYSKWIMIANLCVLIYSNLDVLMLSAMHSARESGIYGNAFKIAAVLQILTASLSTVFMPQAAKITSKIALIDFLKRKTGYLAGMAACLIPPIFFAQHIITLLAGGERYLESVPVFQVLYADNLSTFLFVPLLLWIFAINKPVIYAVLAIFELALKVVGNVVIIPLSGALGAAWVTLIVRVVTGLVAFYITYRSFKRSNESDLFQIASPAKG